MKRVFALALALFGIAAVAGPLLMPTPAQAQIPFFGWGEQPRRRAAPPPQRQQQFNPFGMFQPPPEPTYRERRAPRRTYVERPPPVDSSRPPAARAKEGTPATNVVVLGDAMADWLAYGLEDIYSDNADVAIVRRNRANAGLIRHEARGETYDAVTATKELLAGEKTDVVVMMMGAVDRQSIRERPAKAPPATPGQSTQPPSIVAEPAGASLTHEFRSEKWAEIYTKRIDDMIAVLKSKGVPVLWVGLPVVRGARAKADVTYLNELYKNRAEKAGITYVDVWDGFADENGDYAQYGPDYDGQVRRLRSADGVHFTKAGALKLGHLVERELQRLLQSRNAPVATLPPPEEQAPTKPGGPAQRPAIGPVVPLTGAPTESEGLLGSNSRAPAPDQAATRVLVKGETINAAPGRADDFAWPRPENAAAAADDVIPVVQTAPAAARPVAPAAKKSNGPGERAVPHRRPGQAAVEPTARERQTRRPDG